MRLITLKVGKGSNAAETAAVLGEVGRQPPVQTRDI